MLMWTRVLPRRPTGFYQALRTFLSEEFRCSNEWRSRLEAPFMQKVNFESLYYDIEQTFQHRGKASAIDIDIFVNKATEAYESHTDEISDLLHKFRLTEETSNSLESTGHAVIRNLVDMGQTAELLHILDDRLSYGVFLDHYIASYTMDYFIKKNDYHSAARIAAMMMLQEDFDNDISRSLALYSCYKYLEEPQPFYPIEEKKEEDEKPEVVKVRVKFLRNEFFDNHFDLRDHHQLVGKTFLSIAIKLPDKLKSNVELLGHVLFKNFDKAMTIAQSPSKDLYKDVVDKCLELLEKNKPAEENDAFNNLKSALENLTTKPLAQGKFEGELEALVKETIAKNELTEIEKQKEVYKEWNKIRETKLNEELNRLQRAKRLKEVEKIAEEMKTEEQKLWFFENEDKIDLQIDSKKVYYPKRWFGKKKKPRVVDAAYIPPEIVKNKN